MSAPHARRVMFVDDEEGVRTSWNRYLVGKGFDVTTAEDGETAVSYLREEPVDVVVADLRMPGLDGLELLEWVHESRPDTRFILLTGYGSDAIERKARELGAYEYLNKPISPETLAAVITAAMQLEALEAAPAVAEAAPETAQRSRVRGAAEIAGGLIVAPLLGLAFVIFLPLIGIGAFLWVVGEKFLRRPETRRT